MSIYFILFHNILYINCIREVWFHRLLLFTILIIMVIFTTIIFEIWWDWYCVCICSELIFSPRWPEVFYSRALLHLHHPGFASSRVCTLGLHPGSASRVCIPSFSMRCQDDLLPSLSIQHSLLPLFPCIVCHCFFFVFRYVTTRFIMHLLMPAVYYPWNDVVD